MGDAPLELSKAAESRSLPDGRSLERADLVSEEMLGALPEAMPETPVAAKQAKPSFTVEELLAIPHLHEARLVAGAAGLGRSINRVNVMEVPDIVAWVRPGEFLMTAGYAFRKKPESFSRLIPELVERGVAAFGIKTKRFMSRIPPEAIEAAERYGLPLIELPPDTVFSDVVREVMERVLVQESTHLVILQNRIQTISRLLLEGGGLHAFLDTLAHMLGNPLALVRPEEQPRYSAALRGQSGELRERLDERLRYGLIGQADSRGFRFADDPYPQAASASETTFEDGSAPESAGKPLRIYVTDIPMRRKRSAWLVLLERERDITPVDALTMDRMSPLAGLELMNAEAVREVEGKYVEQFLQDWLSGKLQTAGDVLLRADVSGCKLKLDVSLQAAVIGWGEASKPQEELRELARRIRMHRFPDREFVLAVLHEGELALLFPAEPTPDAGFLTQLRDVCGPSLAALYVGRSAKGLQFMPGSLADARRTRQAAGICRLRDECMLYERLGLYGMLYLMPRGEEWDAVLGRFVDPLLPIDAKGGRMIETLEAFFRCNGNVRMTSEATFTHYNTIVYRLEKAQTLLGVDLNDADERLLLQLALKMHAIRELP